MAMQDFFTMGGYRAYIWPAYALAAAVLVILLIRTVHQMRRSDKTLSLLKQARSGLGVSTHPPVQETTVLPFADPNEAYRDP